MLNIWVPARHVVSEQLLLFAATEPLDRSLCDWSAPADKACHLPPCYAECGTWHFFRDLRLGEAIIFAGDGGDGAGSGVFHGCACESSGERLSFDAREFFRPGASAAALAEAEARVAREALAWEEVCAAMLRKQQDERERVGAIQG